MSETEPNYVNVAAIRERADKATPAPWYTRRGGCCGEAGYTYKLSVAFTTSGGMACDDAQFAAHARADVPALCDEVERLQAQLAKALAILAALHDVCACACGGADEAWERYEKLLEDVGNE